MLFAVLLLIMPKFHTVDQYGKVLENLSFCELRARRHFVFLKIPSLFLTITRRERLKSAPYLRLKKRKTFFEKKLVTFEKKFSFEKKFA